MKKSELMSYLVYAIILAVIVLVGLFAVRPIMTDYAAYAPLNSIVFIILAIVVGGLFNAILVELGHLLGALIGHYKVYSWIVFWLGFAEKDGKMKGAVRSFDGLTGETKIYPTSEKSSPRAYIYMPLVLFLLEVVALVVVIAFADGVAVSDPVWQWWKAFAIVILAVGGVIYIYDIFPAALDSKNDGYLLTVLTNKTNIEAYNDLLVSEYHLATGKPLLESKVYDNVTNFTSRINAIAMAKALDEGNYGKAIDIIDKTIASKVNVSSFVYEDACAQRVSLLMLSGHFEEGKKEYIDLPLEVKKHIASMSTPAAVRAYILVSGLVDESKGELENALGRVNAVLKKGSEETRESDTRLVKKAIKQVLEAHKDWDMSGYNLNLEEGEAAKEAAPAETEEKAPEAEAAEPEAEEAEPKAGEAGSKSEEKSEKAE